MNTIARSSTDRDTVSSPVGRRLRVLLVAPRAGPAIGGVESYLRDFSRGLATEHDVTLLAYRIDDGPITRLTESLRPPPAFAPFQDKGVSVIQLRLSRMHRLLTAPTLIRVLPVLRRYAYGRLSVPVAAAYSRVVAPLIAGVSRSPTIIHALHPGGLVANAAVRAGALLSVPVVLTPFIHEGQWGDEPAAVWAYRRADRVIGLLDHDCRVLAKLGVEPGRISQCAPCSAGVESGGGDLWRRQQNVNGPLVLFLGVRRPYKGFDLLKAALPELGRQIPSVTVVFAGPGDPIAGDFPVRVIDRGAVSSEERAALLEAADVLCLPSASETFGMVLLEAWSVHTAVLTSDIGPLNELVRRSGGGMSVPREPGSLAKGLVSMLENGLYRQLAAAGHRYWRENATVEVVVRRHVDLYRCVLEGEVSGRPGVTTWLREVSHDDRQPIAR